MYYKPGDVDTDGSIVIGPTSRLSSGVANISLEQALRAKKYHWEILPGTVKVVKAPLYVTVHVRKCK